MILLYHRASPGEKHMTALILTLCIILGTLIGRAIFAALFR